jgi:hypothetical protein
MRTELNCTFHESEQGVVSTEAHIGTGVPFGAALADKDVAGEHALTAKTLHAEPATC